MTVGEIIQKYREEHDMSLRRFAALCDLTHGYLSMLENNRNPKTGEPIVPTITSLKKIATAMGITVNELIDLADDTPVTLAKEEFAGNSEPPVSEFTRMFSTLSPDNQKMVIQVMRGLLLDQGQQTDSREKEH